MHTKCDKHQHDKKHTTSIVLTRGRAECLHGGPPSDVVHLALVLAPHQGQLRGLEPRLLLLRLPGLLQRALLEDLHVLLFDEDVRGQLPKHGYQLQTLNDVVEVAVCAINGVSATQWA